MHDSPKPVALAGPNLTKVVSADLALASDLAVLWKCLIGEPLPVTAEPAFMVKALLHHFGASAGNAPQNTNGVDA